MVVEFAPQILRKLPNGNLIVKVNSSDAKDVPIAQPLLYSDGMAIEMTPEAFKNLQERYNPKNDIFVKTQKENTSFVDKYLQKEAGKTNNTITTQDGKKVLIAGKELDFLNMLDMMKASMTGDKDAVIQAQQRTRALNPDKEWFYSSVDQIKQLLK